MDREVRKLLERERLHGKLVKPNVKTWLKDPEQMPLEFQVWALREFGQLIFVKVDKFPIRHKDPRSLSHSIELINHQGRIPVRGGYVDFARKEPYMFWKHTDTGAISR